MSRRVSGVVRLGAALVVTGALSSPCGAAPAGTIEEPMSFDRAVDLLRARRQVPDAVSTLETHAMRGDGRSRLLLGTLLLEGELVPADLPRGLAFVRLGAETTDDLFNASVRKKVSDMTMRYESGMTGRQLLESDRIAGAILAETTRHFLECIEAPLATLTSAKAIAVQPAIRFAEERVIVSLPQEVAGQARLGCAAAPGPGCPAAKAADATARCTGEIVHFDPNWEPGSSPHIKHPTYPAAARRHGITGTVTVAAHVAPDGLLCSATVVSLPSEDARSLATATLDAMRYWRVDPALRDGRPVESLRLLGAAFRLIN
jgi:TonB family protein